MSADKEKLYADELVTVAQDAARAFESYDQAAVDRIVEAVYRAGFDARVDLAQAAVDDASAKVKGFWNKLESGWKDLVGSDG